jgi:hypothetical protein
MAKEKQVKLPSGHKVKQSFLCRVIIEGAGDTIDYMELKELEPRDLHYIFGFWLSRELGQ